MSNEKKQKMEENKEMVLELIKSSLLNGYQLPESDLEKSDCLESLDSLERLEFCISMEKDLNIVLVDIETESLVNQERTISELVDFFCNKLEVKDINQ